jgi:hypothetical protein
MRHDHGVEMRAEFCLQPVIGQVGLHAWAWRPLALVRVELTDQRVLIARAKHYPLPLRLLLPIGLFKSSWSCSYQEIELAQTVVIPGWLDMAKRDKSLTEAVRLHMGPSKARPVLLTHDIDSLLSEFALHDVEVDRIPLELNRAWIGRK